MGVRSNRDIFCAKMLIHSFIRFRFPEAESFSLPPSAAIGAGLSLAALLTVFGIQLYVGAASIWGLRYNADLLSISL